MTVVLKSIEKMGMKISELAKQSGISPRMLRYYEQEQLLAPARSLNGYREYQQSDIERVKIITQLNNAGLTLKLIKQILPCWQFENKRFQACEIYKHNLNQTLHKIEQQIKLLKQTRIRLIHLISS